MTTHAPAAWTRPRPGRDGLRADAGIAILLALAALTTSLLWQRTGVFDEPAAPWVWALGLGLSTLPLALRRRYPVPVAILVSVGFFICGQFGVPEMLIVNICLFLALYTVGAWESRRSLAVWAQIGVGIAMIAWLVLSLIISSSDADAFPGISRSGLFSAYATFAVLQIITNLMYFGGAYFFGERSWRAARAQAQLEAQGRELELERRTSAEQAVTLDRLGIARELHDVVAHHVSVMGIQAAAARRILERGAGDGGTGTGARTGTGSKDSAAERAVEALETVEQSARSTVEELRRLVRTLRAPEVEGGSSTVGIAQLPALVAASQSAGTPTVLIVAGEPRPLPMLVDIALYRVAQEALTNVRKHAGRGASAEVRLRFGEHAVEIEVSDDGVLQRLPGAGTGAGGAGGGEGSGLGLRGMRERIGAVGGTVTALRREQGGFLVRASVPNAAVPKEAVLSEAAPDEAMPEEGASERPTPASASASASAPAPNSADASTAGAAS